jgi:hypothetical protein
MEHIPLNTKKKPRNLCFAIRENGLAKDYMASTRPQRLAH